MTTLTNESLFQDLVKIGRELRGLSPYCDQKRATKGLGSHHYIVNNLVIMPFGTSAEIFSADDGTFLPLKTFLLTDSVNCCDS